MNIDFVAAVNKTSGTPFKPSGSSEASAPGFLEQINQAIRDNDRKDESTVEKKPAERKKTPAAETQNSAKTDVKASASKKKDRSGGEYADTAASVAQPADSAEEMPETAERKSALAGDDDPGFYDEFNDTGISETENASAPRETETSETDDFTDSSASADARIFPAALVQDDSGFAAMMNMTSATQNASYDAVFDASQKVNAIDAPFAGAEAVTPAAAGRTAPAPQQETADPNIFPKPSVPGDGTANAVNETLKVMTVDAETADEDSANQVLKDTLKDVLALKNPEMPQNADRDAAAMLRGQTAGGEATSESKASANTELLEPSKQPAARPSEGDAALLERLAVQTSRQSEDAASVKASENAGKTGQVAETSVQATPGTGKAEAVAPARSANMPEQEFVVELAGRIQAQIRGGREMIRIQLHPEELGRLEIRAETGRNGIIARIAAESDDVKKLLESSLQGLKYTLETRGLKVDRLHIIVEENFDAALADGGRYDHAGTGPRGSETSEFSKSSGAGNESPRNSDDPEDLSETAEQRGAGFYAIG